MCKCLNEETVKMIGKIVSILTTVISIPLIALAIINFKYTDLRWYEKSPYRFLAILNTVACAILFVSSLITAIFFALKQSAFQIVQFILSILSSLFCMAIGIMNLVAAVNETNVERESCNSDSDYKGVFKHFQDIDLIFTESDKLLCGNEKYICLFYEDFAIEEFQQTYRYAKEYDKYEKYERIPESQRKSIGNFYVSLKNATDAKTDLLNNIKEDSAIKKNIGKMNKDKLKKFIDFWGDVEEKFNCTGWCDRSYDNSGSRFIYKYLYSNVNRGVAKDRCLEPYRNWFNRNIKAYGSLTLIGGFFQIFAFITSLSLFGKLYSDSIDYRSKV